MTKLINVAIGITLAAILASVGVLAYFHFQGNSNVSTVLQRDHDKWQQQVDENPSNHLARANLGAIYLDMGDTDSAIKELTIALDQEPKSFTYMNKLADAYVRAGDQDVAIALYMQAADLLPAGEKYAPLYKAAEASQAKGDNAGAKDFLQKSMTDNDIIWNSHFLMGQILEAEGDMAGAKSEYAIAAKYNSTSQEVLDALARVSAAV